MVSTSPEQRTNGKGARVERTWFQLSCRRREGLYSSPRLNRHSQAAERASSNPRRQAWISTTERPKDARTPEA